VNELVLEVADLDRAERFYSEMLGFPVVERWEHREAVWVLAGATRIGLWKPQVGIAGGRGGGPMFTTRSRSPGRTTAPPSNA
jgi:catechol 2,3-dioxygenase-like lactoylglutathione lyase family enzyme